MKRIHIAGWQRSRWESIERDGVTEFTEPATLASQEESFGSEKTVDPDGDRVRRCVDNSAGMTACPDARVQEGDAVAWTKSV